MAKKPHRDPGAPKRNMSAYLLYQNAMRDQFKALNPGMTFGQLAKVSQNEIIQPIPCLLCVCSMMMVTMMTIYHTQDIPFLRLPSSPPKNSIHPRCIQNYHHRKRKHGSLGPKLTRHDIYTSWQVMPPHLDLILKGMRSKT